MPAVKEGLPFIFAPLALGIALLLFQRGLALSIAGGVFVLAALFCLFFFRDPRVTITQGEKYLLSPCNGTVMEVIENDNEKIVRVFLSIFNVHIQRSPVAGRVRSVEHRDGEFLMAMHPEAFMRNEQNIITIESECGVVVVKQIAGFLARRCVSWVSEGDVLAKGDKIGLIKFSSQVDMHIPKSVMLNIHKGDKLTAGRTICGELP